MAPREPAQPADFLQASGPWTALGGFPSFAQRLYTVYRNGQKPARSGGKRTLATHSAAEPNATGRPGGCRTGHQPGLSELHRIASRQMKRERPDHILQTTALVHEAYLRLVGGKEREVESRGQFFAIASQQMRRILVDFSRRSNAQRRGSGETVEDLDSICVGAEGRDAWICWRSTSLCGNWSRWIRAWRGWLRCDISAVTRTAKSPRLSASP